MLIPYVSTYFRLTSTGGYYFGDLTLGRIYKIEKWATEEDIIFRDDVGDPRNWCISSLNLEDTSFVHNLEKILE